MIISHLGTSLFQEVAGLASFLVLTLAISPVIAQDSKPENIDQLINQLQTSEVNLNRLEYERNRWLASNVNPQDQAETEFEKDLPKVNENAGKDAPSDENEQTEESRLELEKRLKAMEGELKKLKDAETQNKNDWKKTKDAEAKKKEEEASKPVVKPRGRIHIDSTRFHQSSSNRASFGDIQDGSFFRRARLGFDAKAFEVTEYRLDFEMASGGARPSLFDAYGRITNLPMIGNLQIGHFREPFSLEALTSSNWFTFMERGLNNTFDPSRNWGVMSFDCNEAESLAWGYGVFREGADNFGDDIGDSGELAATSRVSWLPYFDEGSQGRYFFELGGSYSYRDPDNRFVTVPGGAEQSIVRYQGRPGNTNEDNVGTVPAFVNASVPNATNVQLMGIESTWNVGSLNFQTEYVGSYVERFGQAPVLFHGTYVQTSYFLTGESRQWDRKLGYWGRAQVFEPFFRVRDGNGCVCSGRGAWELVARWNYLDLSDRDINGGYLEGATFGANWYLNPYVRMMFNYSLHEVHSFTEGRSDASTFAYRLDVHF